MVWNQIVSNYVVAICVSFSFLVCCRQIAPVDEASSQGGVRARIPAKAVQPGGLERVFRPWVTDTLIDLYKCCCELVSLYIHDVCEYVFCAFLLLMNVRFSGLHTNI